MDKPRPMNGSCEMNHNVYPPATLVLFPPFLRWFSSMSSILLALLMQWNHFPLQVVHSSLSTIFFVVLTFFLKMGEKNLQSSQNFELFVNTG